MRTGTKRRSRNRVSRYRQSEAFQKAGGSRKKNHGTTEGRRRNGKPAGRKKSAQSLLRRKTVCILMVLILAFIIILVFRQLCMFAVESRIDPKNPYSVEGVDVSTYQLEIDWKGLESEGIDFAFIKATEGTTHVDDRFAYNWKEARKTDMRVGAYHFLSYETAGETQADNYIRTVGKKRNALPPVVDVEFYGKYVDHHPSEEKLQQTLDPVLEKLEKHYKKRPILYTNTYIYNTYLSGRYDDYDIWISDPGIPDELPDGRKWTFCQYTFQGTSPYVAGGTKYIDRNVFHGTKWDLRQYDGN